MNKTIFTVIGFALFLSGMYALVLSLVGAKFTGLLFLEKLGASGAFFTKIAMVFIGILIIFLSRTNTEEDFPMENNE